MFLCVCVMSVLIGLYRRRDVDRTISCEGLREELKGGGVVRD